MSKLILQMQVSVDGYAARKNGSMDWCVWDWSDIWTWDKELKKEFNAIINGCDCILPSRGMAVEGFINHWTGIAERHEGEQDFAFAQKIADVDKVVFTKTLDESVWPNTVLAKGDLKKEINVLKQQKGGNIIAFGGVTFASSLIRASVVDELQLFVNPTALGSGLSIFDSIKKELNLSLIQAKMYDCGIVVVKYKPE